MVRDALSFSILEVSTVGGCSLTSASSSSSDLPLGEGVILSKVSRIFRAVSLDWAGTKERPPSGPTLPLLSSSLLFLSSGPFFLASDITPLPLRTVL